MLERIQAVAAQVGSVVVGKQPQIRLALACLLARGHLLIEDLPGVGKTTLAQALSISLGLAFKRVQFTNDLLPADIVGVSVFERDNNRFTFHPGPVFSQVLLADEINRASPKTQSALLEAMEERQVSIDGAPRRLPDPFFVIATQNPQDQIGTFPLPESQLDRFLMRFTLGYPTMDEELRMLTMLERSHPLDSLQSVADSSELLAAQNAIRGVRVDPKIRTYILQLVHETRSHEDLALGGSPRATIALFRCAQAFAAIQGRTYVLPDDVKRIVAPVLNHRIIVRPESRLRKVTADKIVAEILAEIAVPTINPTAA
jgi:MoxR-like ATPase